MAAVMAASMVSQTGEVGAVSDLLSNPLSMHNLFVLWPEMRVHDLPLYLAYEHYFFVTQYHEAWLTKCLAAQSYLEKAGKLKYWQGARSSVSNLNGLVRTHGHWEMHDGSRLQMDAVDALHKLILLHLDERNDRVAVAAWLKRRLDLHPWFIRHVAEWAFFSYGSIEKLSALTDIDFRETLVSWATSFRRPALPDEQVEEMIDAVKQHAPLGLLACLSQKQPNHPECLMFARQDPAQQPALAWEYFLHWRSALGADPFSFETPETLPPAHSVVCLRFLQTTKRPIIAFLQPLAAAAKSDELNSWQVTLLWLWEGNERIKEREGHLPPSPDFPHSRLRLWRMRPNSPAWQGTVMNAFPLSHLLQDCQLQELAALLQLQSDRQAAIRILDEHAGERYSLLADLLAGRSKGTLNQWDDFIEEHQLDESQVSRIFSFI